MFMETSDHLLHHVFLLLCERCNLICGHCIHSCHPKAIGQLDCNVLSSWLCDAEAVGLRSLDLSGGEPLLAEGFSKLLQHVLDNTSLELTIASNLGLVRRIDGSLLKQNTHRLHWRVAIESMDSKSHDTIRGEGSFSMLWNGLEYLRKHGIDKLACNTIIRPEILNTLPSFVKALASYGFNRHNWICLLPFGRGKNYINWEVEPIVWFNHLRPIAQDLSISYHIDINLYGPILRGDDLYWDDQDLLNNYFPAIAAFANGKVYRNCFQQAYIEQKPIGNIISADFARIKRNAHKGFKRLACKKCMFRFACYGIKIL